MADDEIGLRPPCPREVALRALVLSALVCRGNIDNGAGVGDAKDLVRRLRLWLRDSELEKHTEPWEAEVLAANLGTLNENQIARASWAVEGLAVLVWALQISDFPRHDQQVDPYAVTGSVGLLSDEARAFVQNAELRAPEALRASREVMYAIHCRLRDFIRNKTAMDFTTWIEPSWLDAIGLHQSRLLAGRDLRLDGTPIQDAAPGLIQQSEWVVREQHRASIWLIGEESPTYWDWPVDT